MSGLCSGCVSNLPELCHICFLTACQLCLRPCRSVTILFGLCPNCVPTLSELCPIGVRTVFEYMEHNWDTVGTQSGSRLQTQQGQCSDTVAMQLGTQFMHTVKTHFKFQTQLGHSSNFVVAQLADSWDTVVTQLGHNSNAMETHLGQNWDKLAAQFKHSPSAVQDIVRILSRPGPDIFPTHLKTQWKRH